MPTSRIRQLRTVRGLSQVALAEAAQLSRQSVHAIEAGRTIPGVDVALELARVLGCQVEDLFGQPNGGAPLQVALTGPLRSPRLGLGVVRDRWIGVPLGPGDAHVAADALAQQVVGDVASVTLLRPMQDARRNLVLMGCATGLGLLAGRLQGAPGDGRALWCRASNGAALQALSQGHAHVVGVHQPLTASGSGEATILERAQQAAPGLHVTVIALGTWRAGLLSRADSEVQRPGDLGRSGLRLAWREPGAGARGLLEEALAGEGLPVEPARDRSVVAAGHLEVASAIALGAADVGVATWDAASAYSLRFVPLVEERFDLIVPTGLLGDVRVERLLDVLCSAAARQELASLGYDVRDAGKRVAWSAAA